MFTFSDVAGMDAEELLDVGTGRGGRVCFEGYRHGVGEGGI